MISIKLQRDFSKSGKFLSDLKTKIRLANIDKYGERGVEALSSATPVDSGLTASAWYYEIERTENTITIHFKNSNVVKDYFNVALMLQFGHGTRNGGWVEGRDYINPAIRPVFDKMIKDAWEEVIRR